MALLTIVLRDGGGRVEFDTTPVAAQRVFNRYIAYLRQGEQPGHKFVLDGQAEGALALDFANVLAMHVGEG